MELGARARGPGTVQIGPAKVVRGLARSVSLRLKYDQNGRYAFLVQRLNGKRMPMLRGSKIGTRTLRKSASAAVVQQGVANRSVDLALIRGGRMDVTVMGAYEVSANGDFANWKLKGAKGGGIGGAMDLAASAQRVYIMLEHRTRDGASRLLPRCTLPITATGVVTRVVTDPGLFDPHGAGFACREFAPGVTV